MYSKNGKSKKNRRTYFRLSERERMKTVRGEDMRKKRNRNVIKHDGLNVAMQIHEIGEKTSAYDMKNMWIFVEIFAIARLERYHAERTEIVFADVVHCLVTQTCHSALFLYIYCYSYGPYTDTDFICRQKSNHAWHFIIFLWVLHWSWQVSVSFCGNNFDQISCNHNEDVVSLFGGFGFAQSYGHTQQQFKFQFTIKSVLPHHKLIVVLSIVKMPNSRKNRLFVFLFNFTNLRWMWPLRKLGVQLKRKMKTDAKSFGTIMFCHSECLMSIASKCMIKGRTTRSGIDIGDVIQNLHTGSSCTLTHSHRHRYV